MKHSNIELCIHNLVGLVLQGRLVQAYTEYYHQKAWLPQRTAVQPYVKGKRGLKALQFLKTNKCLYAEKALLVGVGSAISCVDWTFSGTEGSAVKNTFSVMSIQYWEAGKVVHEEFLHAN